ncbi:diacylglycerol/lipid kinase family protein [Lacticaseibacillus hegangensis]|uniref:Diacylglycerol/lipid kinase family protein n=1 Tax=Lacticaseibacillus hegangensis TaxID=2486010 RepID=A0ABW4CZ64_9LACO|nr:diacylglycerol kinase family protein [Lacticaseibacillus hegangensis]
MAAAFYYIIFNPAAGSGNAVDTLKAVRKVMNDRQIDYEVRVSRYSGHTVQLAKQIGSFNDHPGAVVLVIGGDGTLNQTITGLKMTRQADLAVGYIPAGSGNDFARGIGLPDDPMKALECVLSTETPLVLDIGQYTEQTHQESGYFVNNIGVGYDGNVIARTSHSQIKTFLNRFHLGKLSYFITGVIVFFAQKPFPVIVYDQQGRMEIIQDAFLVDATNHPYFGGGIRFMPGAVPTDGELDLVLVEHPNWVVFLFYLIQLIRGKEAKYDRIHHFKGNHLRLETTELEAGQMDGEEMGTRPFELEFTVAKQNFWFNLSEKK